MFNRPASTILSSLLLFAPLLVNASIFSQSDVKLTFYYDIGDKGGCGKAAGDPVPAGWADSSGINAGTTYCEQQRGMSLNQIGTNRIVAFDQDKVWADPAQWCGREVKVYGPDGIELIMPDGPFYIWDSCQNCAGGGKILDVSGEAFVKSKGGTCGGNNPTGFRYNVMDNYVVDPSVGLQNSGGGASSPSSPVIPGFSSTPAAASSASVSPTSAGSSFSPSSEPAPPVQPPPAFSSSPLQFTITTVQSEQAQPTAPTSTNTGGEHRPNNWGGWGGHGNNELAAAPTAGPVAAVADSNNAITAENTCRRKRKRRLAKLH
ncbi:hypothetical protein L486_00439 [Kwoniella mangroviensis CBS 10435]|uniref:Barwin domain-containing protein n=1 Tax=Kwoniella mangroviensis CBS 10435 TaxID=1331196 RepID=A0A1B9IZ40_9TREE|nr:uncharacterized protein I203_06242 [Kwoniella mangroviensis CBS 8507]OCF60799.1 hypothetical protein L486_00439 [Kwoniella mangroviensis CBS 10435]OCF64511.1 hypothetical protein I203_06242 [Kwoniella mangroviensis CBS 8507]OCF74452.1 hypothetical protein I204_04827 [Kwoniella mangroviensis CBS 8886]